MLILLYKKKKHFYICSKLHICFDTNINEQEIITNIEEGEKLNVLCKKIKKKNVHASYILISCLYFANNQLPKKSSYSHGKQNQRSKPQIKKIMSLELATDLKYDMLEIH